MPLSRIQKVGLVTFSLAGAYLFGTKAFAKPTRGGGVVTGCNPMPYTWSENNTRDAINELIDDGATDALQVATKVANDLYGDYPGGGMVNFPPKQGMQLAGVECIWSRVVALVTQIFKDRGVVPKGDDPKPWEIINPYMEDPEDGGMIRDGSLLRVRPNLGMSFYGTNKWSIAYKALENAGVPSSGANRIEYTRLIQCSPWNDALTATAQWDGGGYPKFGAGRNGRAIPLNANHADNKQRMLQGNAPRRAATDYNSHDGTGGKNPLIWLPKIEHNAPAVVVALNDDGTSGINPPRDILNFGLENVAPGSYGCDPFSSDAEPLQF